MLVFGARSLFPIWDFKKYLTLVSFNSCCLKKSSSMPQSQPENYRSTEPVQQLVNHLVVLLCPPGAHGVSLSSSSSCSMLWARYTTTILATNASVQVTFSKDDTLCVYVCVCVCVCVCPLPTIRPKAAPLFGTGIQSGQWNRTCLPPNVS